MQKEQEAKQTRRQLRKLITFLILAVIFFTALGIYAYLTPKPYKFIDTQIEMRKRDHPQGIGAVQ
ncbi:hypothetical protein LGV61_06150 [Desulfurispirillum indicum]|uniref:hypothetical protein n=1 Tax=Desulfurispirillum indicum TaxID=936456 RepID=UPI001CFAD9E7|nr:hypothetical protein [Desulfurispirillum indicum]UCZ57849.1 hypothetical protein LGV61_06150 [Desulfurispirillum indicum]